MNTFQLQCVINCDIEMKNKILGGYAADKIPKTMQIKSGFIANTDPHQQPGKHWIAFFYDNGVLECFDSYGHSPDIYSVHLGQFMRTFYKIKVNKKRIQSNDTVVCGQYCLFYLMCRSRGYSMDEIVNIFNENYHLNDQFVYNFIDERFHCCMLPCKKAFQICSCEK